MWSVFGGRIGRKMPARLIVISTIPGVVPTVWRKLFQPDQVGMWPCSGVARQRRSCPARLRTPARTGCRGYEGNALSGLSAMGLQADADSRMIAAVIDSLGSNTYFRY